MPKFKVLRTVSALLRYTADVEADDAYQAASNAYSHEDTYSWSFVGTDINDARYFVTLEKDGPPMKTTKVGNLSRSPT